MKKFFAFLFVCMSLFEFVCASQHTATQKPSTDIKIVIGSGTPRPRPKSISAPITAELDGNMLFISFQESVGKVSIQVQNSFGQVVASCNVDTIYEPMVMLNVPTNEDYYTIHIVGDQFEAYGAYNL